MFCRRTCTRSTERNIRGISSVHRIKVYGKNLNSLRCVGVANSGEQLQEIFYKVETESEGNSLNITVVKTNVFVEVSTV